MSETAIAPCPQCGHPTDDHRFYEDIRKLSCLVETCPCIIEVDIDEETLRALEAERRDGPSTGA